MGTRSTTKFIAKRGEKLTPLVNIYQQFDGYIDGVGHDLANFLKNKKIINGISSGHDNSNYANGLGCLIAQYIKEFKKEVGNLYITDFEDKEEYNYEVIFDEGKYFDMGFGERDGLSTDELIIIKVDSCPNFEGTPSELLKFEEGEEDED